MGTFIAVRPDDTAIEDLQEAIDRVRRLPMASAVHWLPPHLWHVTVAFLGHPERRPDGQAIEDEVAERIAALSDQAPIDGMSLRGSGCFGRDIVWMGLAGEGALSQLQRIVTLIPRLLRGSGADPDRRPWRPHLTVGRTRGSSAQATARALQDYRGPQWRVRELLLLRSTGGPHPVHHALARVHLEGTP